VTSGVKVTSIVHEASAASEAGHAEVNAKSPETLIELIASGPFPVLASVIVCGALVVDTVREANVSAGGVSDTTGARATPVPESGTTVVGLAGSSLRMFRDPAMLPGMSGVNVTLTVQVPAGAMLSAQVYAAPKSPLTKMLEMLSVALPVLVMTSGTGPLVVNTVWGPNAIAGVDSDTAGTGVGEIVALTVMGAGFVYVNGDAMVKAPVGIVNV
jgi:hypothetical protein